MNRMFYEYRDGLEREAQMTWERLTTKELNEVGGNVYKLEKLIRQKYGFSIWEARKQVAALLDRYDNLAFISEWNQMQREILNFWHELNEEDIDFIHCSRTRLLDVIQERYDKSREQALKEVNGFLRRFLD